MFEGLPIATEYVEYLNDVAIKWQKEWERLKVYCSDSDRTSKFFITAAFMYPNSPAHIGHARVYLIADVIARYARMQGHNTLYPMGFHYTGTPILAMSESIAKGDKSFIRELEELYNLTPEDIELLKNPLQLAKYFHKRSKDAMIRYGLGIDWRREFTTVDPEFQSFIRWQFEKLREKNLIERGSHPVGWCPNHQMPVGMHDTKDDVEPEIDEVVVINFVDSTNNGVLYPVATLRPETVLGVTNLWVKPDVEYCRCEVVREDGRRYDLILSRDAAEKLSFQMKIKIMESFKGSELVGRSVINPLSGNRVKVLEAEFVDPKFGTGLVMSVPAHAPYDYVALVEYFGEGKATSIPIIPLIVLQGYSEAPARDVVTKLGIKSQNDVALLEKATKEIYLNEYANGVMREDLQRLVVDEVVHGSREFIRNEVCGVPVPKAREKIKKFLMGSGYALVIYEIMNRPVYCRCGSEIVVKVLENQWFINYGDPEWKKLVFEALSVMRLIPEETRKHYEATVEWLQKKACARSRGLGTELPWEKGWIIESLSDSTIYMAFYTVIHKIREYSIPPDKLTKEFWDYVILGVGDVDKLSAELNISPQSLINIRKEFTYWYPLDVRCSGKDLIPNHLTFFIFNHVAIFPKHLWPKSIVVNGWVLREGEKMSKSKRNVLTLEDALRKYSPDGLRASLMLSAEVEQDLDFRENYAYSVLEHIRSIESLILKVYGDVNRSNTTIADEWLMSRLQRHVKEVTNDLNNVRLRSAAVRIFYLMYQDLVDYLNLSENSPSNVAAEFIESWIKMMVPYTPHIAEEIWHRLGKDTLAINEDWPSHREDRINTDAELSVEFVKTLINDVREIAKFVKEGRTLYLYVSRKESYGDLIKIVDYVASGKPLNEIVRSFTEGLSTKELNEAVKKVRRLYDLVISLRPEIKDLIIKSGGIDEGYVINSLTNYIKSSLGVKEVVVYYADDADAPNFGGKKGLALPFKPGIYMTS
ncbi:MAG: leucine--tRNA ligase [Sulfolobales archaeon]